MVVALVFVFVAVMVLMSLGASRQMPWSGKLKRIRAGVAHQAEWMAPEDVVRQVQADYLAAVAWLQSGLDTTPQHAAYASMYCAGAFLQACQTSYQQQLRHGSPRFVGVMRADHAVQVRYFSERGDRCLVLDCQTQRRMATYDRRTHERMHTQDLGEGTLVYQMAYDDTLKRWKITAFIQELPPGCCGHKLPRGIKLAASLPPVIGRDS